MIDSITDSITQLFPDLAQRGTWIGWFFGLLCSLLALRFKGLLSPDLLGHKWMQWIGIIDLALVIFLLCLPKYSPWWYLVLLAPLMAIPLRECQFRRKRKQLWKQTGTQDYDIARYQYLEWVERHDLFRWEVKRYYLPALNILFEIGAMSRLDETLKKLEHQYGHWYEWKRLKSYLLHNRQEYQQMIDLIQPYEDDSSLSVAERHRTVLNLFSAYRNTENVEGYELYLHKIDHQVFEEKHYTLEAFDDLLYYYEKKNDTPGMKRISDLISSIKTKDFSRYLEFQDLLYMHNQRKGDRAANIQMLDKLRQEHHSRIDDEELRLRFDLRVLKLMFENNYQWQQYSSRIFDQAKEYLSYSPQIAFEYMEAVFLVIKNGETVNKHIPEWKLIELFRTINDYISRYLSDYDHRYTMLPDDFLYRKKEMLMRKVTLARIRANLTNDTVSFAEEVTRLLNQIIVLCQKNGNYREMLHFQVVLTDELLAIMDYVTESIQRGVSDNDIVQAHQQFPTYTEEVCQQLSQIDNSLRQGGYDRTQAYYMLYSAYFHHHIGEFSTAKVMLHKYEATGIDVTNFTLAIQMMYAQLKRDLQAEKLTTGSSKE